MHDHRSHSLLQQLPLSVSPFIHLPTAVTLPYSYQTLPLSLPHSSTSPPQTTGSPVPQPGAYIVSPSGTMATTPAAVIQGCQSLIAHLQSQQKAAEQALKEWEKGIEERELMEKRRVAPGYLDTGMRMLEPMRQGRVGSPHGEGEGEGEGGQNDGGGEEFDRVFGKMGIWKV